MKTISIHWKRVLIIWLLEGAFLSPTSAQNGNLETAARPLDDGVPQVAVMRLRGILSQELTPKERQATTARLGEALLAAGEAEEALKVLQDPDLQTLPEARF